MIQAISLATIALLVVIDQLIKIIIEIWLKPIGSFEIIPKIIQMRYVQNTGAAFGMLRDYTNILSIVTAIALVVGLIYLLFKKDKPKILTFSLVLVLSGGLGNLIDRVFRGFVIDFIEPLFVDFAVFNFADSLISVGAVLLLGYMMFDIIAEFRANKVPEQDGLGWDNDND